MRCVEHMTRLVALPENFQLSPTARVDRSINLDGPSSRHLAFLSILNFQFAHFPGFHFSFHYFPIQLTSMLHPMSWR